MFDDDKRYELEEEQSDYVLRDRSAFNRLDFAMRALAILKPANMDVVVYERIASLHMERGIEPRKGPDGSWATVGIPPHASREHIALSLCELVGANSNIPYLLDVLVRA